LAGIPESIAARAIEHCNVKAWIIPLGEPFIQPSWLSRQPLSRDSAHARALD
jgi:hypothetical protein